ncbi:MAG TPA: hypothetical protein ENI85_14820 [Deltaproteobacteria bacterium]|nr:hypothetical protein [Deltaproteobacteria bacterium]
MRARGVGVGMNRTPAHVRKLFAWLAERELVDGNPVAGKSRPAKEAPRDRVLDDEEIRAVWRACDGLGHPYGPFVKLLILTGQRRGETAAMLWADLDLEAGTWTIPPGLNKSGRPHLVHLSEPARAILGEMPHVGPWVFTTTGAKPINSFGLLKRKLDDLSDVTGWRLHDLR